MYLTLGLTLNYVNPLLKHKMLKQKKTTKKKHPNTSPESSPWKNVVHELMPYYQDMVLSGILLSAAFILLRLLTQSKPIRMATINRSRRATVTPTATGTIVFGDTAEQ